MLTFTLALLLPWLASLVLTPAVLRLAQNVGFLDVPDPRKCHSRPTALLGGAAVFGAAGLGLAGALAIASQFGASFEPEALRGLLGFAAGILAMLALGTADDRLDLAPAVKLLGQVAVGVASWLAGCRIGEVELPFGFVIIDAALLSLLLTTGWIVLVTNAFNLLDGMDGLTTGTGVIVTLTLYVLATSHRESVPGIAALALAGALAGFLRFNLPPARIFLGDGGALAIGYSCAVISIATYQKSSAAMVIAVPLLVLGLPLLDVALAILRRGVGHLRARGLRAVTPGAVMRALFRADRAHVHHLLMRMGLSSNRILFSLYALCGGFALLALLLREFSCTVRWGVVAATAVLGLGALRWLEARVLELENARAPSPLERGRGGAQSATLAPHGLGMKVAQGSAEGLPES